MTPYPYPWQEKQWRKLSARLSEGRLGHALMLVGVPGLGKLEFARAFASAVLCSSELQKPCGNCEACTLFTAGNHPDFFEVGLPEDKKVIAVDQIRQLSSALGMTSQLGAWKVALLHPADAMNANAANSLLKTLEEPPGQSLLLLVTARPAGLPGTVRSRCQGVVFDAPERIAGQAWLAGQNDRDWDFLIEFAAGAPLTARELAASGFGEQRADMISGLKVLLVGRHDPIKLASEWRDMGVRHVLEWLASWVGDLIRVKQLGGSATRVINADAMTDLQTAAEGIHLTSLHYYLDAVRRSIRLLDTSANEQLLLESLLIPWAEKFAEDTLEYLP